MCNYNNETKFNESNIDVSFIITFRQKFVGYFNIY